MIIVASKPGQLGNMLFQFAHIIACATENNLTVINPAFEDYAEHFKTSSADVLCRYPARKSRLKPTKFLRKPLYEACHFAVRALGIFGIESRFIRAIVNRDWDRRFDLGSPEFVSSLKPYQLIFTRGWLLNDHKSLRAHCDKVRKYFEPLDQYQRNVSRLVAEARQDADVLIGVHVRQGIKDFANARQFYYAPERYAEIMKKVAGSFQGRRVSFLIGSDTELDPATFAQFRFTMSTGHLVEDLYAFAQCDYLMGPPSTYTLWASFYGQVPLWWIKDSERDPAIEDFLVYLDPSQPESNPETDEQIWWKTG